MIRLADEEGNETRAREIFDSLMGGRCRHPSHATAEFAWVIETVYDRTGMDQQLLWSWLRARQISPEHTGWHCPR